MIAGIAAGVVIAIKPHFALAIVPAVALAAWQARALRPMIPAAAAAVAVVALYAAAVIVFTPDYLQLLPMLAAAYLPLHDYWLTLLRGPVVIVPLAIYALALFLRPGRIAALPAMFLIASAGFAVAGLIQGKGYLNHALPGMALGFVGLVLLAFEPGIDRGRRNFVLTATAALAGLELYAMASIQPTPGLAQAVTRVAPPRPSVITLGPDLLTGHPLVRNVNGRWAGSRAGMYIAVGAHSELSAGGHPDPRLLRWYEPTSMLSLPMCGASGRTSSWSTRAPSLPGCEKSRRFKAPSPATARGLASATSKSGSAANVSCAQTKSGGAFRHRRLVISSEKILLEAARHVVERAAQLGADVGHRANGRNGNESGNQAVLNGGRALLIFDQLQKLAHGLTPWFQALRR